MNDIDIESLKADSERRRIMMNKGIEVLDGLSKDGVNFPVNELAKIMLMRLDEINNLFVSLVINEDKIIGLVGGLVNMTSEITTILIERVAPALVEGKKTKELQNELKEKYDSTLGSLNEVIDKIQQNTDNIEKQRGESSIYG